jgi:hypothetical protein
MSRVFLYHYLGDKERKTIVENDPDKTMAIPERGEIFARNGSIWRVNSVVFAEHEGRAQTPSPVEVWSLWHLFVHRIDLQAKAMAWRQ